MFKLFKTNNGYGIKLLYLFQLTIEVSKGILINTIFIKIEIWKFIIAIYLGKEKGDAKKTKQNLKESKSYDAFA